MTIATVIDGCMSSPMRSAETGGKRAMPIEPCGISPTTGTPNFSSSRAEEQTTIAMTSTTSCSGIGIGSFAFTLGCLLKICMA